MVKIASGDAFEKQGLSTAFDQAFDVPPQNLSLCGVIVKTWKDFLTNTNIDGLNNAGRSTQRLRTFIWFLIFTIGLLLTVRDVKDLVEDYFCYPVDVSTTLSHENSVPFPSVTVCNMNRVSCKRLEMLEKACAEKDEICEHPEVVNNIVKGSKCGKGRDKRGVEFPKPTEKTENPPKIGAKTTQNPTKKGVKPTPVKTGLKPNPVQTNTDVKPTPVIIKTDVKPTPVQTKPDDKPTPVLTKTGVKPTPVQTKTSVKPTKTVTKPTKTQSSTNQKNQTQKNVQTKNKPKISKEMEKKMKKEERRMKNKKNINLIFGNSSKINFNRNKKSKPPSLPKKERSKDLKVRLLSMKVSKIVEEEHEFLKDYMELSREERMMIGHDYGDLVKSCTFRGVDCSDEMNVTVTSTPVYGNCFTIGAEDEDFARSSLTGANYGLSLVLNIEAEQYQRGGQTQANGARMSIQDQASLPLVEEYGLDIAPHSQTSIALQLIYIKRQEAPYPANCTGEDWSLNPYRDYLADEDKEYFRYSLALCQRLCLQQSFQQDCQCSHPRFGEGNSENRKRPCRLVKGSSDRECVNNIITEYDTGERKCECSPSCQEYDFEKLVSSTVWPGEQYIPVIQEEFNIDKDKIEKNLLRIDIYFMSLNIKFIVESPRYKFVEFISILGGAFGVWVGFSVCVLFEIVELVIDVIINVLTH